MTHGTLTKAAGELPSANDCCAEPVLAAESHQEPWQDASSPLQAIQAAAIKSEGCMWTMERPARHADIISWMASEGEPLPIVGKQGFVTNHGRFVGRWRAHRIAFDAGQTTKPLSWNSRLFSEDLW